MPVLALLSPLLMGFVPGVTLLLIDMGCVADKLLPMNIVFPPLVFLAVLFLFELFYIYFLNLKTSEGTAFLVA